MQIYGPTHVHGAQGISSPHSARGTQPATSARPAAAADEVNISEAARLASQLADVPEIRHERVAEIRAAIQSGVYETDDKLSAAVDRLLDEIG